MNRNIGKKGTEKPIEIFVALFIILAVAMVMLKVFNTQITQQQDTLTAEEQKREIEFLQKDAKQECSGLCSLAQSNQCSDSDRAEFCMRQIKEYWSKGPDGTVTQQIGPIRYCEDTVYCPQIAKCECGRELNMENCVKLICGELQKQGFSLEDASAYIQSSVYNPGDCFAGATGDDRTLHWYTSASQLMVCS